MAISLGGLATGLDTGALIQQLLAVERRPVATLETRKLRLQAVSAAFQDLRGKLQTLRGRADALRDPATFFARSARSSAEGVATATAAAGGTTGTFTLIAGGLARGSIAAATQTTAALTDTVAAADGSFAFRLGAAGATVTVPLTAATTLEGLAAAINGLDAGARASLINAGTAADPAFKLILTSIGTGAANDITILTDDTTLGVTTTQTAVDASFTISGLGAFTRATNTITDVLDGVTLTLKAEAGTTDLTIELDAAATQARLQGLLDAYNDVVRTIDRQALATRGSDGRLTPGAFTGDLVPRQLRSALAATIRTRTDGSFGTLAEVGVTTATDGTLSLDGARFQAALAQNPAGVRALVAGTDTRDGVADRLATVLADATRSVSGPLAARQEGLTASIRAVERQIDTALARLETTERLLRARFDALERTVAELQSTGNALLAQLQSLQLRAAR